MKLWLLKRLGNDPTYGCFNGFVIRAETENVARVMAAQKAADEGATTWMLAELSSCEELPQDGDASILLFDFNAG